MKVKKVVEEIGHGGFARVDKIMLDDGRSAARKVFDPQMPLSPADREKAIKRFEREVRIQDKLTGYAVMPVWGYDFESDPPSFIMPLAERNYLEQISSDKSSRTISPQPLADILNGLEELHQLGLVHRDLKPDNILYYDNAWRLADFGFTLIPSGIASRLTSSSSSWGTQGYMAPEQLTGFREVTPAADIYAFGCILHDLVDGGIRIPFQQYTCKHDLAPIIEKCTFEDPNRRFQDIGRLRSVLLSILTKSADLPEGTEGAKWVNKLDTPNDWKVEDLEGFVGYLKRIDEDSEEEFAIYNGVTEQFLEVAHTVDRALWGGIAECYCTWSGHAFEFGYADAVAGRLHKIFMLGTINIRAMAAKAMAELGSTHNRFYVMRKLLSICGEDLDEPTAKRIALEIQIDECKWDFRRCADVIDRSLTVYHPLIYAVV